MKLKIYRQSGTPVAPEQQQQYTEEYRAMYDRCEAKAELLFKKKSGKLQLMPMMLMLQRYLRYAERFLMRKFSGDDSIELPTSAKQWTKLIESYGDIPLMLAKEQKTNKIVLIVMDDLN